MELATNTLSTPTEGTCHECGSGKVSLNSELRYFTFFSIPIFCLPSRYHHVCASCGAVRVIEKPERDPISKLEYFSKFVGLLLIALLVAGYFIYENHTSTREKHIITHPQPFDFYIINQAELITNDRPLQKYAVAKLVGVSDKVITYRLGRYSYETERGLIKAIRTDKLLTNGYFLSALHTIPKEDLLKLHTNGAIVRAMRPRNLSLFGGLVVTPAELSKR